MKFWQREKYTQCKILLERRTGVQIEPKSKRDKVREIYRGARRRCDEVVVSMDCGLLRTVLNVHPRRQHWK